MCGLCTKYKRLPLPIPVCLQRGLNLGLPISHCQLPLAASQIASAGGASEVGSQAFSDHSQLCNCDEASPRFHLPAEWKQRSAFTPHSRAHRHAANSRFAAVSQCRFSPGLEGISPASPGSLVHPPCPRPVFPSPISKRQGKKAGARWRGEDIGWEVTGAWVMASRSRWEAKRPRNDTLRAALTGPTQMTHFCCIRDMAMT